MGGATVDNTEQFVATHVIQTGTRRWYVHAEKASDPRDGLVLYTWDEWQAGVAADWAYDEVNGLSFQDDAYHPMCDGAEFMKFETSVFRDSDGWNEDGTMKGEPDFFRKSETRFRDLSGRNLSGADTRSAVRVYPENPYSVAVQIRGTRGKKQFMFAHGHLDHAGVVALRDYLTKVLREHFLDEES
jgi:hypothetical protein